MVILGKQDNCSMTLIDTTENWIFVEVVVDKVVYVIGSVYCTRDSDFVNDLENLQKVLDVIDCKYNDTLCMIGGDFNAWVANGNEWPSELFDESYFYAKRNSLHRKIDARG